jgi:hypothetical protein
MSGSNELVRLQLLLRREEREVLEDEARRLGISMSEVVRRALRGLAEEQAEYDANREDDPFFKIIGIAEGYGDRLASVSIDDELYGPRTGR